MPTERESPRDGPVRRPRRRASSNSPCGGMPAASPSGECLSLDCGDPLEGIPFEPGDTVLDLGCDAVSNLPRVAPLLGEGGHFIGVNGGGGPASRRVGSTLPRIEFINADPTNLPVDNGVVDWVVSCCSLSGCTDLGCACHEIGRVLKPGGRVSAVEVVAFDPGAEYPNAIAQTLGRFGESDYFEALRAAGLRDVHIVDRRAPSRAQFQKTFSRSGDADALVGAVWIGRILAAKAPLTKEERP